MSQKNPTKKLLEGRNYSKRKYPRGTKRLNYSDEDGLVIPPSGMKKQHLYANKHKFGYHVGINLKYIKRFLRSRIGQDWNEVYSELCEHADSRTFQGNHLRDWLEFVVDIKTHIKDGKIVDHYGNDITLTFIDTFYVHPETNKLEATKPKKIKKWQDFIPKTVFELEDQFYHEHEGIWYRVQMRETRKYQTILSDQFVSCYSSYWSATERLLRNKYGYSPDGKIWYCVHKESANSREINKLKKEMT